MLQQKRFKRFEEKEDIVLDTLESARVVVERFSTTHNERSNLTISQQ